MSEPHAARRSRFPSRPGALALSIQLALAGGLIGGTLQSTAARAAEPPAASRSFNITGGPLGDVLAQFAAVSGTRLSFDPALVAGRRNSGLQGSYSVRDGFAAILAGSGLELVGLGDGAFSLKRAAPKPLDTAMDGAKTLAPVTVTAEGDRHFHLNGKIAGGALGTRTQLETPFSTTVVTQEDLAERQVSKLGDVFALDASVTDNSGAYSSWASYVTVRGLELDWQNSYRIDGKPFMSYAITLPYEHFEQIELLKGASGFMYGFGSPGGLINYVTKKPSEEFLINIEAGYKSNSVFSQGVDLGGRFGNDKMFGYRLNAVHEEGKTFNDGEINRDSVSLALDARLTRDLTWDFQSLYQKRKTEGQTPSISTAALTGNALPGVVDGDNQNLLSKGQFLDTDFQFYSTGLKYRVTPDWVASTSYSQSTSKRSRNEGILYLQNSAGDYNENRSDSSESHRFDQWQGMLEGKFNTGRIEHHLVVGAAWQKQLNDYSSNGVWLLLGAGNVHSRNGNSYYTQGNLNRYRAGDITQKALFVSDTLKLSEAWSVLLGLRHTRYTQNDLNPDGTKWADYSDNVLTPSLALMYRTAPGMMLYTSYVESLEPGKTVGSSYANANRMLDPLVSKQYELGFKAEREHWSSKLALFRIERPSEYADSANYLVQDGQSEYQGLELSLARQLDTQWLVAGNLMLLDTSYDKGNANIGKRVAGAPKWMATAHASYNVPQLTGLKLLADAKYTGDIMLNAANTLKTDDHVVLNLGASYLLNLAGHPATLRAAINNVTNERYWEYQYANWIKPADPRSFSVNARFEF